MTSDAAHACAHPYASPSLTFVQPVEQERQQLGRVVLRVSFESRLKLGDDGLEAARRHDAVVAPDFVQ